jgi:hypothetical protein
MALNSAVAGSLPILDEVGKRHKTLPRRTVANVTKPADAALLTY